MTLTEQNVIDHLKDRLWIRTNKKTILRSIKQYSEKTVDELFFLYEDFQDYIITQNLYSKKTRIWTLNNISELGESSFSHFCQTFPDDIIDRLYKKVMSILPESARRPFYCILWEQKADLLTADPLKVIELFSFSFEHAGQPKTTAMMKNIIRDHPELLNSWISYDTKRFIRFYHEFGKLVYFDDNSMDLLTNSLQDKEMNEFLLKYLFKDILAKKNCSVVKQAGLLFLK